MTKQEYQNVKVGDKVRIKAFEDKGRIVTIGTIGKDPWFKFNSAGKDGFMIGQFFYPYKYLDVVKD